MNNKQDDLQKVKELNKKSRENSTSGAINSSVGNGMISETNDAYLQETRKLNQKSRENKK